MSSEELLENQSLGELDEEMEEACTADIGVTEEELDEPDTRGIYQQLPEAGAGFYSYAQYRTKQFGAAATLRALEAIAAEWNKKYPNGPRIGIGNISLESGGPMKPHVSHRNGYDVDLRLVRKDQQETGLTFRDANYSRERTQDLVDFVRSNSVLNVRTILFNDPNVKGVSPWKGHDDHLHVSFLASGKTMAVSASTDRKQVLRLVSPRMQGENVRNVQAALNKNGFTLSLDGVYGTGTAEAVEQFQEQNGLTPDGAVGPQTAAKLGIELK
jgi:Putative peptidoglycan binding domain/Penicillin-insensitive murein endopeptidase